MEEIYAQNFQQAILKAKFLIENHKEQVDVPGLQLAISIDGNLIWSENMGYSDIDSTKSVTDQTQFRTASVAKPLTSIALGKLLENNLIKLDTRVKDLLPEMPAHIHEITVQQLASSTSGIRHYLAKDPQYSTENFATVTDALEVFKKDPLAFTPGSQYSYSSFGWVLLSAMMEKASDHSFNQIMTNTWKALGASNTTFDSPDYISPHKSNFYVANSKGERIKAPFENRSFMYAGGGYLSTAIDLVTIGEHILNHKYLTSQTFATLTNPIKLSNGKNTYYGLGWEINRSRKDFQIFYHNGSMPTARTHWVLVPEENIVFAYLSNTGQNVFFNDREAHSIVEIFYEAKQLNKHEVHEEITGNYRGKITSLKGKSKKASLQLIVDNNGLISGELSYTRSRRNGHYPIILIAEKEGIYHFMAPTPMFADFYLRITEHGNLEGFWQHDLVNKPDEEVDAYWKKREVALFKE